MILQLKTWIGAFRLRTLPLALSGIFSGTMVAEHLQWSDTGILIWASLTAVCLQILSNLANDYGDFVKGTDNNNRLGNTRALQSGKVSLQAMQRMITLFIVLCLGCGITLLRLSFPEGISPAPLLFFALGVLAICAAVYYTMGKRAYGYSGKGDLAVFLFFGPVAVGGTFLLHTQLHVTIENDYSVLFPALSMGLLSAAVLNTNNLRDHENDRAYGKRTLVVMYGVPWGKQYHTLLIWGGLSALWIYGFLSYGVYTLIIIISSVPVLLQWKRVLHTEPGPAYNAYLKQLSLGVLLLAFSLWICNLADSLVAFQSIHTS